MPFTAFTIDANMVYRQGFDLEHGLLAQLRQFAAGDVRFVLSDLVLKELLKRNRSVRDKLRNALKDGLHHQLAPGQHAQAGGALLDGLGDPRAVAQARLDAFVADTGAEVIPVDNVATSDLIELYFASKAPFQAAGAKKAEFPDAIALLSLQAWAEAEKVDLMVASADEGWAAFAADVDALTVVDDLGKALSRLQNQSEAPDQAIRGLMQRIMEGGAPQLAERLRERIAAAVESLEVEPVGDSYFSFDAELEGVRLMDFEVLRDDEGKLDLAIVRVDNEEAVFQVEVSVTVEVDASFALRKWDGIDREYVRMGSTRSTRSVLFIGGLLVHLIGDYEEEDPDWEIDHVDLVDGIDSVDFGEIEPDRDWADDFD